MISQESMILINNIILQDVDIIFIKALACDGVVHIGRVYVTGGFKQPRELIWITGIILAVSTASFGVTGYSLPWDQVGYWACKIVTFI